MPTRRELREWRENMAKADDYLPQLVDELVQKGIYPTREEAQAGLNKNRAEIEKGVAAAHSMFGPMFDKMVISWKGEKASEAAKA